MEAGPTSVPAMSSPDRQVTPSSPGGGDPYADLPGTRAAYAVNWRRILVVDAAVAVVIVLAGLAVVVVLGNLLGVVVAAAGVAYLVAVVRRYRTWRGRRRAAGFDV